MFPFPLELTAYIASLTKESWITMSRYCPDFHKYAYTGICMKRFLDLFTEVIVTSERTAYSVFGKLHRDCDKPAEIWADGTRRWYKNKKRHRCEVNEMNAVVDKPAEIWADGTRRWYKNKKRHRGEANEMNAVVDKPAVICVNGSRCWYENGKQHRDGDKPAIIQANGNQRWYKNGVRIKSYNNTHCVFIKK